MTARALVLRTAGTNCEVETAYAFELVGVETQTIHIAALIKQPRLLGDFRFVAIPGGFSYGDDVASGRIFANELLAMLGEELSRFIDGGGYAIGICNGFQVLVKAGLLPRLSHKTEQQATLTHNISGRYEDRWVRCRTRISRCAWMPSEESQIELPVAHAEGRFTAPESVLNQLQEQGQIALCYEDQDNFNGSQRAIAGICDPSGRVLGLMPHPERFLRFENHPCWTRLPPQREGQGVSLFRAAARHAKEN
ncbi:MAG: phosphoribosylformylglycinamidine synthase subunit PurQ [Planctomycetota bacterium]|nr:MAG: phosphoribosylformylglycinamidine synthase subunit PurQ [Planctomycetota bacterium]